MSSKRYPLSGSLYKFVHGQSRSTALRRAVQRAQAESITQIMNKGGDITRKTGDPHKSPLQVFLQNENFDKETAKLIINRSIWNGYKVAQVLQAFFNHPTVYFPRDLYTSETIATVLPSKYRDLVTKYKFLSMVKKAVQDVNSGYGAYKKQDWDRAYENFKRIFPQNYERLLDQRYTGGIHYTNKIQSLTPIFSEQNFYQIFPLQNRS